MTKAFVTNLALIVFLNLVVKPLFIFGIDVEVQNQVGSANYGLYFALLNFSFLFNILLDLGINNYNTKTLAAHPHLAQQQLGSLLGIRTVLFVVYALFTIVMGLILGYTGKDLGILAVLVLNQFFVAIILFMRSNFSGLHRFRLDALFSILDRILLILICTYLLWYRKGGYFQVEWFVWAQTFSYGCSAILALLFAHNTIGRAKVKIRRLFSLAILRQSFPYALLILLMMIYNRMDSVMLERIHPNGAIQTGIYAQGFRLLDAVTMFALLFAGLLLPILARMLTLKESINELVIHAGSTLFIAATVVSMSAYFYASPLMDLIYDNHISESADTFQFLILSFIPISLTYIFGTLLTANGSLKYLNIMAVSGILLNFLLNFLFIPDFGAYGAALATLITQWFTSIVQIIIALYLVKLKFEVSFLIRLALFILILLLTVFLVHELTHNVLILTLLIPLAFLFASFLHVFPIKKSLALLFFKDK